MAGRSPSTASDDAGDPELVIASIRHTRLAGHGGMPGERAGGIGSTAPGWSGHHWSPTCEERALMTESSSPEPAFAALHDRSATSAERRETGKAARSRVSRRALGHWDEAERGHDALETGLAQNQIRVAELVPLRPQRLAASPWNYYRGAAAVMARDLASQANSGLMVQLCGDAHVLNFGLWATPERNLMFDLRDFDETLPGPFEWDVKRLAASLVVVADANGR